MRPSLANNHFTIFGEGCEYIATCQIPKQKITNSSSLLLEASFWILKFAFLEFRSRKTCKYANYRKL